jgi:hypothetical protein
MSLRSSSRCGWFYVFREAQELGRSALLSLYINEIYYSQPHIRCIPETLGFAFSRRHVPFFHFHQLEKRLRSQSPSLAHSLVHPSIHSEVFLAFHAPFLAQINRFHSRPLTYKAGNNFAQKETTVPFNNIST